MAKIALVSVAMHGHVNPTLGFTQALVGRGHEVIYFADESFAPQIARAGAKPRSYGSQMGQKAAAFGLQKKDGASPFASAPSFSHMRLDELESTLPQLLAALQAEQPDLVVYSFISLAARLASEHLKIPALMFFTTYASNEHFDLMAKTFAKSQNDSPEVKAACQLRLEQIVAANGLPAAFAGRGLDGLLEPTNLVFMPRSFQPEGASFDQRFAFIGPCLRASESAAGSGLIPAGSGPLALVSLGTIFHAWPQFYADCIQAFTGTEWRVVMAIGPHTDPASLGELPPNIVVRAQLPQIALLQQADLFITHGGMNSTMEALYHGVPMLVLPQMEEQELTAEQVDHLHLGRYLRREELTAAGLAEAVKAVFASDVIRSQVDLVQADVQAAGGTERAVALIEAALPVTAAERKAAGAAATLEVLPAG